MKSNFGKTEEVKRPALFNGGILSKKLWENDPKGNGVSFLGMLGTAGVMCLIIAALVVLSVNVRYEVDDSNLSILDSAKAENAVNLAGGDTVIIYQNDATGKESASMMNDVLNQMRVKHDSILCTDFKGENLKEYKTIILSVTSYQTISELISYLPDWLYYGGNLMIMYLPDGDGFFGSIKNLIGIERSGYERAMVEQLVFEDGYMIGADNKVFTVTDAFDSALDLSLDNTCDVYVKTTDEYALPVVWSKRYGDGSIVVNNFGIFNKVYRGFYAASYSLLDDYCVYPVINSSVFYIDDFPSPVPEGDSQYIYRDYGLSIKDFYSQEWWVDVYNLAQKYSFSYTGLVIEAYSDQVDGEFLSNEDVERYRYFGNLLLDSGGEIGLHGYNHMPLVLDNFNYEGDFDSYNHWGTPEDIKSSIKELKRFIKKLYPECNPQVYVPPSNIISKEAIKVLEEDDMGVVAIASVYNPGDLAYEQEFNVSESGMINTPRIISGYTLSDFTDFIAMCELNMHFVNTHFQHPDDVLDVDRGAEIGWEKLFTRLEEYCDWLYTSAPQIRSHTGSELAGAVQRYDYVGVNVSGTDDIIKMNLENFYDEAWFILRLNSDQKPSGITGGEITSLEGNLYLIKASDASVSIKLN